MKMSISLVVAMGMTASLFAGEQDTAPARDHKRARKEVKVVKDLDVEEIVEFVLPTISNYVTEDGKLIIAGVTSVTHDELGRTIVEIKYYGDFEQDFVLTIPRPVRYDEQGDLIGVQGPDSILTLEGHAVYVFDTVETEKGLANKAGPTLSVENTDHDNCELFQIPTTDDEDCLEVGTGCKSDEVCDFVTKSTPSGRRTTCDCIPAPLTP